jgi:hypothetical protein
MRLLSSSSIGAQASQIGGSWDGAEPTWAQTYDPKYPVCLEVIDTSGGRIECSFTSMEQCKNGSTGTGSCFANPYYKPPPPEPEPVAETAPAPAAKSKKTKQ